MQRGSERDRGREGVGGRRELEMEQEYKQCLAKMAMVVVGVMTKKVYVK